MRPPATPYLVLLLAPSVLLSQQPSRAVAPRPGHEVWFQRQDGAKLTGEILGVERDSVVVQSAGTVFRLGSADLNAARVRTGSQPATGRGMGLGALIGGGIGVALGAIAEGSDDCGEECSYQGMAVSAGLAFGAIGGAVVGGLIGSRGRAPRWARVAPPGTGAAVVAWDLHAGDGVRIAGDSRSTGVVLGGTGDSVRVRLDQGAERSVPVSSLERYLGERSGVGKGLLVGGAVGLGVGVLGIATDDTATPTAVEAVAAVSLATAMGAVVGALFTRRTRPVWAPVAQAAPHGLTISPTFGPDRLGVTGRVEF